MTFLFWTVAVFAEDPAAPDYVVRYGEGQVNWTRLEVQVTRGSHGSGTQVGRQAIEQRAIDKVDVGIESLARRVALTSELLVGDLAAMPEFADPVRSRMSRWTVSETRYFASGKVEVDGALPLQQLLKPWTMERAQQPPELERQPLHTGVVIDARGTGATPCFAPELRGADGEQLWAATLWTEASLEQAPVLFVLDPSHPAASRAGDNPFLAVASSAADCDVTLGREDTLRFTTAIQRAAVVGQGRVVFVLDPP